jgi:hypothetical protein
MHSLLGRSDRSMKHGYYVVAFKVMSVGFVGKVSTEDKTGGPAVRLYRKQNICCKPLKNET